MYRVFEVTGPVFEITDKPIALTMDEVRTLESNGFRCKRVEEVAANEKI